MLNNGDIIRLARNELKMSAVQKGKNFFFLCPFHNDKNPSLSFNAEKKFFYCFGCGFKAADFFHFWSKVKEKTINDSYKEISSLGYISSSEIPKEIENKQEIPNIYKINKVVSDIYWINLRKQRTQKKRTVFSYLLKKRGIIKKTIDDFSLGCSSFSNQLSVIFEKSRSELFNLKNLIESGLSRPDMNQKLRDYFSGNLNLIIPLFDEKGIISFASRKIISDNDENSKINKYYYLPNNKHFKKSSFLYHYHKIIDNQSEEAYLVEGFFDVISLCELSINNCFATLGTSISDIQLEKIFLLKKRIVIFPDDDEAGNIFALKLCKYFLFNNIDCEVVDNQYGVDPDKICHLYGGDIIKILNNRINPYDFLINFYLRDLDIRKNPQRLSNFFSKISSLFENFDISIRSFVIDKLVDLTNAKRKEIEWFFSVNIFLPIIYRSISFVILDCKRMIFSEEEKIIDIVSSHKFFTSTLISSNYKFSFPENQKKYSLIYSNYISNLSPQEEEKNNSFFIKYQKLIYSIISNVGELRKFLLLNE